MSGSLPRPFKIIALQENNLPQHNLNDVIIHCRIIDEFERVLIENPSSTLITVACAEDKLPSLVSSLAGLTLDTMYVLTDPAHMNITWPIELIETNWEPIKSGDEKQLMRYLCFKAALCYYKQAMEYKRNGDNGLKDTCLLAANNALNQVKLFL